MLNVIKVRLYPTKSQQSLIHQHFGSCRLVYNLLLDAKIKAFECNDNLSIYDLKKRLAKRHLKIKNKRNDFLHKITKELSENQTIKVENLKIKNMSKQAKGSIENPNLRASAKSGLNRMILQQSWGKFFELLEYKLKRNGGELIRVNPKNTSKE